MPPFPVPAPLIKGHGPEVVAMVHVHCTTAILNHGYTHLVGAGVSAPTPDDNRLIAKAVSVFVRVAKGLNDSQPLLAQIVDHNTIHTHLRSAVFCDFLLDQEDAAAVEEQLIILETRVGVFQGLVKRALEEVTIYARNGVRCVEVENVAAPYFIGPGRCPWEEIIALHLVGRAIRRSEVAGEIKTLSGAPLMMGIHILSTNELEVLPLAIMHGARFVRSEATLFTGIRPEGEVKNDSNLARFFYVRQVLRNAARSKGSFPTKASVGTVSSSTLTACLSGDMQFPQVWSDVKKKHTVFLEELQDISTWLHNINFMKLEGVIVTGEATGSDVDEEALKKSRAAIDSFKKFNEKYFGATGAPLPELPLITGSGLNFSMYSKYADYCIVGTALKKDQYWENEVCEDNVRKVMTQFGAM